MPDFLLGFFAGVLMLDALIRAGEPGEGLRASLGGVGVILLTLPVVT